jgi:thiosulfate dehydrogenase
MRHKGGILSVLVLALIGLAPQTHGQTGEAWPAPNADSLAAGAFKDTVLYGRKLFSETYSVIGPEVPDAAMRYSGNNLSCQSCHLRGGTQKVAIPMIGVYGVFPVYI